MVMLSMVEVAARAREVRLVCTDVDGVLTDAGVYYTDAGEVMKRFSMRDGMGVELLREAGIETLFITGERSGSIARRAEKLGIADVRLGIRDKRADLDAIARARSIDVSAIAYIGDDVNDLTAMLRVAESGLTGAPSDATREILAVAHHVCRARGGFGAFRDFAEWILSHRGKR